MTVRILHGDALEQLQTLAPESVHSVVTDPPYGLEFMGKAWDSPKHMRVLRPLSESVPKKEFQSARMFVERLGLDECLDAAEIAVAAVRFRNAFRYFCGVCWNRLRDRE